MRRGATKEEIIHATQVLITRNGIRAVRVDEIAQQLGISKRTLYELFADKTDLIAACLDDMNRQQQEQIAAHRKNRDKAPFQQAGAVLRWYIDGLCSVNTCFLSEIRHKIDFSMVIDDHRRFYYDELTSALINCREAGFLLPDIEILTLAERILQTVLELRLGGTSQEELYLFCRTLLRGVATQEGIDRIDRSA